MTARCKYPSSTNWEYYGGRGIRVCDEWASSVVAFAEWAEKNGYEQGLELDRIDVNGDYSPDNCRFITHKENSRLRRNTIGSLEVAKKIRKSIAEGMSIRAAGRLHGVTHMVAWHIHKGNCWND